MKQYHIFSGHHNAYYRHKSKGYTEDIKEAGVFSEKEANYILLNTGREKLLRKEPVFDFVEWLCYTEWIADSETTFFKERENITVSVWIEYGFVHASIKDVVIFDKCLIPTSKQEAETLFKLFRLL